MKNGKLSVQIESDIAMPSRRGSGLTDALRVLANAKIGDSVFLPGTKSNSVYAVARAIGGSQWVVVRKEEKSGVVGARVWKAAEAEPSGD